MKVALFVYGTLKRGGCRAHHLRGQEFLGTARTAPKYRMYNCGEYPGLVEAEDGLPIEGELWRIDEACLKKLDEVEGVDAGLYRRGTIELGPPYENEAAIAYFYCPDVTDLPDCGARW